MIPRGKPTDKQPGQREASVPFALAGESALTPWLAWLPRIVRRWRNRSASPLSRCAHVWLAAFWGGINGSAVAQHFRDALRDFGGVVAHANDGICADGGGVLNHDLVG